MARARNERRRERPPEPRRRSSVWRWLRNNFFAGIVVATPITVTAYLVYAFITFVDANLKPRIPDLYNPERYLRQIPGMPEGFAIPGLGLIFAIIVLTMLGAFARNFFGRSLLAVGERVVSGLPIVRNIYRALKQLVETIAAQSERSFKEVALVEYPRRGLYALAFVTAEAQGELAQRLGDDVVGVFIPTTPNPTSGFLLYARRSELQVLDMSVEDGAKLIISAGLVTPGQRPPTDRAPPSGGGGSHYGDPAVVFTSATAAAAAAAAAESAAAGEEGPPQSVSGHDDEPGEASAGAEPGDGAVSVEEVQKDA